MFEARGIAKRFGDRVLFANLDLYVTFGERVGIIGPNGAGKTTLVRVLTGAGGMHQRAKCAAARGVLPFYAAQEQEQLDPDRTVIETLRAVATMTETDARTLLACFLFREGEGVQARSRPLRRRARPAYRRGGGGVGSQPAGAR